jgi:hypothetical protein
VVRKNSLRRILAIRNIVTLLSHNERTFKLSSVNVADSKRIQAGQHFDEGQLVARSDEGRLPDLLQLRQALR